MKYKVGDRISCKIEIFKDNRKKLSIFPPQKDSQIEVMAFPIIAVDQLQQTYKIIMDPDIVGWDINKFHIRHLHLDDRLLGKRFYDIAESLVINTVVKKKLYE